MSGTQEKADHASPMPERDPELEAAFDAIRNSDTNVGYYDREASLFSTPGGYAAVFVPETQKHAAQELLDMVVESGAIAKDPSDWRVLDVGCSVGSASFAFSPHVREVVGTDIEPATVAAAETWRRKQGISNVSFHVVDGATGEGMPGGLFDLILMKEVAEHVGTPERLAGMLGDLRARLALGGALVLETPNYLFPFEPHLRFVMPPLSPRWLVNFIARLHGKGGAAHRLFMESLLVQSPQRIARIARANGFAVRDAGAEILLPWMLDGRRVPRGDFSFLAPALMVMRKTPLRNVLVKIARLTHAWPTTMFILQPAVAGKDAQAAYLNPMNSESLETSKVWIAKTVAGKRVLEIGGLGDLPEYEKVGLRGWQHDFVKKHAQEVIGIDIDRNNLARAQELGFAYQYGDIEDSASLPQGPFDVLLMIDVIEHLNNVGSAFASAREHMSDESVFVISTPSPWALNNIFRALAGKGLNVFHDHTNYMVADHFAQLAERYGFDIARIDYFTMQDKRSFKSRLFSRMIALAGTWNPVMHSHIWVELKKKR